MQKERAVAHELLVAMHVVDDDGYQAYRDAMKPILAAHGGGFGFDFDTTAERTGALSHPVTRVFGIHFPSPDARDQFFGDPAYAAVKAAHYERSVDAFTVLAEYDVPR